MPEGKPFNDFFLLGLDHLANRELFNLDGSINANAKAEMQRRIEYGKNVIREQTKEGGLIAFEAPHRWTFEQHKRASLAAHPDLEEQTLKHWWNEIVKDHFGFYAEIAEYAESIGRKVVSLETRVRMPNTGIYKAYAKAMSSPQKFDRIKFLTTIKVGESFFKKIQKLKPKMVIVSGGHAASLEATLVPRKLDYFPKASEALRRHWFAVIKAEQAKYARQKKRRLQRQRELAKRRRTFGRIR